MQGPTSSPTPSAKEQATIVAPDPGQQGPYSQQQQQHDPLVLEASNGLGAGPPPMIPSGEPAADDHRLSAGEHHHDETTHTVRSSEDPMVVDLAVLHNLAAQPTLSLPFGPAVDDIEHQQQQQHHHHHSAALIHHNLPLHEGDHHATGGVMVASSSPPSSTTDGAHLPQRPSGSPEQQVGAGPNGTNHQQLIGRTRSAAAAAAVSSPESSGGGDIDERDKKRQRRYWPSSSQKAYSAS